MLNISIFLSLLILSIFLFNIGFHNIDIAINLKDYESDMLISGEIKDRSFIYRMGVLEMYSGFLLLLFILVVSFIYGKNNLHNV